MSLENSALERYPDYEAVIGMEVHVQLTTKSKIFCGCKNGFDPEANQNICPVCCGYPGTLPVLNKQVVDFAILAGLATNCSIAKHSTFDRKHYTYPDLPKGYQITQQDHPICNEGYIPIKKADGSIKKIRIIRIHMEEDAGKNIHAIGIPESLVNLNRAGSPLLEIVSYPDISNTDELRSYLKQLRSIVQYLGICTANMEEGTFRADTNISVRKKGENKLGTKCELKNINSFKFISDATEYEIERQIKLIQEGKAVQQETRLWNTKLKKSVPMRSKEEAQDYRYFEEPDLPYLAISESHIERIKTMLPELPAEKEQRLITMYNIEQADAEILIDNPKLADYFETVRKSTDSKRAINWLVRDMTSFMKEHNVTPDTIAIQPLQFAELMQLIEDDRLSNTAAQTIFARIAQSGESPTIVMQELGLEQINATEQFETLAQQLIAENPEIVAQYKAGKTKLLGFFVGQIMKATKGKGNPQKINAIVSALLDKA